MPKSSIRVSIDALLLERIDRLVRTGRFRRRSEFIQLAIEEKLTRFRRDRLAAECAKLDPDEERAMAEERMTEMSEQVRARRERQLAEEYATAAADPVFMEEMGEMDRPRSA